ncbi:MAG: hypothetical protein LIO65_03580, partial [Odoribacter sp.]|nr:hypothetical protein [Odoribacter sp.]
MASDWFSSRKEKKELERSLEAVKIELQENLEVIKNYAEFYEESELLSLYLNSTNKKDLNLDSLQRLNAKQNYDISTRIIT